MVSRWSARSIGLFLMLLPVATFAEATPYPPYPGAMESDSYKVTVNGQPVFVHKFLTFNQFNWMDYASFSMTGKVRVEVTLLVSERRIHTAEIRPIAYGIKPQINGNTITFELDRPRYLVLFLNEYPSFYSTGLMLFAEPTRKDPPKLGDANVVNIQDYQVDSTGKAVETARINQAISDVSARDGGGVLFFPPGIYTTGTVMMKSNVKLYVGPGAVLRGSRKDADYTSASSQTGGRQSKAFIIFDNVENAALMGPGTIDMQGYPWLWHDFQPDNSEGLAREETGKVRDPRNGVRGYLINNSRNVSFQDLLLLRSAYWTINIFGSENFTTRNIKVVNRKQQYHDDAYDFRSSRHIRIEDGFAMTMDDTWAFYGGGQPGPARGVEDIVVRGFVNYTYTAGIAIGYGSAPPIKGMRFEDVHFVANHNKFAVWIQLTPTYFTGRGYSSGTRFSRSANLDDFRFVNCTFENDGGHIYIDGGEQSLKNFAFENCTFYAKPTRPSMLMGQNFGPVLFKNVKFNDSVIRNAEELKRTNFDLLVPVKVEE